VITNRLSDEAVGVAEVLRDQLRQAGGVDLLRGAVAEPERRADAERILGGIGAWELNPLSDGVELEAAAMISQVAGEVGLPYPVAERLGHAEGAAATALVSATDNRHIASHADLDLAWSAVDFRGHAYDVVARSGELLGTKLGPFASEFTVQRRAERLPRTAALVTTLQGWWLLGLLKKSLTDTARYTREREQFGRALRGFQSVAFGLADMAVALDGLEELAKYALWSIREDGDGETALTDALSLRVAALEAAQVVLRGAHQYHGAMGFTDEVDVSWLSRASQSFRRLPEGESATQELLAARMSQYGFAAIFAETRTPDDANGEDRRAERG